MKKKRNEIEYTSFTISPSEISQALTDADKILKTVRVIMESEDQQQKLINL
jgi:hypothetical protein